MKRHKHLSWDNFMSSVFVRGQQRVHRISGSPIIELFGDGIQNAVGVWIECSDPNAAIPDQARRLASVSFSHIERDEKTFLEIATSSPLISREFYLFATAIADRILELRQSPTEAVTLELRYFAALLEEKQLLSIERQLGLLGELIVLEKILSSDGPAAVDAWIGPQGEPHDFRLGQNEFEVKTSASTRRIHTINGLTQLVASPGSSLFIISILVGPAGKGGGFTLPMKIQSITRSLQDSANRQSQFETALQSLGYSARDDSHYARAFVLRRPLALVPVDSKFPAVTASGLLALLGPESYRVDRVVYDINIEGLESEEGTNLYSSAFPFPGI